MPTTSHPSPEERARTIMDPALAKRDRLEFVLALSHELRTPVGIITGYTSLARQGEVSAEEALDVVDLHASELSALLELLLQAAISAVEDPSEAWNEPLRDALTHVARVKATESVVLDRARRRRAPDRRNETARAARDELAGLVQLHPRDLGTLPVDVVTRLLDALERGSAGGAIGA